jgi:hypothetical protein
MVNCQKIPLFNGGLTTKLLAVTTVKFFMVN